MSQKGHGLLQLLHISNTDFEGDVRSAGIFVIACSRVELWAFCPHISPHLPDQNVDLSDTQIGFHIRKEHKISV